MRLCFVDCTYAVSQLEKILFDIFSNNDRNCNWKIIRR